MTPALLRPKPFRGNSKMPLPIRDFHSIKIFKVWHYSREIFMSLINNKKGNTIIDAPFIIYNESRDSH